jgi:hypothetical protein
VADEESIEMQDRTKLFIDGEWVAASGKDTIDVVTAAT